MECVVSGSVALLAIRQVEALRGGPPAIPPRGLHFSCVTVSQSYGTMERRHPELASPPSSSSWPDSGTGDRREA